MTGYAQAIPGDPICVIVGSEEARLRASLRPPLKLHVRFSRMQLSRRLSDAEAARLRTPLLRYGAPHLSARGTSTLLNNALLSTHFRLADDTSGIRRMGLFFM